MLRLEECIAAISNWLASRRLLLNGGKTEFIQLGTTQTLAKCPPCSLKVDGCAITPAIKVRSLGVLLDQQLSMDLHVGKIRASSFSSLRLISRIRKSLNKKSCSILVRSLVLSHLNFCVSLLVGCNLKTIHRLKTVQNSLLQIIEQHRKCDSKHDLFSSL